MSCWYHTGSHVQPVWYQQDKWASSHWFRRRQVDNAYFSGLGEIRTQLHCRQGARKNENGLNMPSPHPLASGLIIAPQYVGWGLTSVPVLIRWALSDASLQT